MRALASVEGFITMPDATSVATHTKALSVLESRAIHLPWSRGPSGEQGWTGQRYTPRPAGQA
jgi:hypothetical protein